MRKLLDINKALLAIALSLCMALTFSPFIAIPTADATPSSSQLKKEKDSVAKELAAAQDELDNAADLYDSALTEKQSAESTAQALRAEMAEKQSEMESVQDQLSRRVVEMYVNNERNLFLNILLGSSSLSDMITNWNAFMSMNENDSNIIHKSKELKQEIAAKEIEASEMEMLAAQKTEEAQSIKDNADAKTDELQNKIDSLDKSIREQTLIEAARAAGSQVKSGSIGVSGAANGIPTNGNVVDYAKSRLGCPYVWAASGPNSFDCSGLVMWCYAKVGKSLPHNSEAQKNAAVAVIPVSEAQPGDVLWRPGHVGICTAEGGGQYIHAPHTGDVVRVAYGGNFRAALRF